VTGSSAPGAGTGVPAAWTEALEYAADRGRLAPSVHNTQPWAFVLLDDRLELRADRSRQLTALDPSGRELVQSVGAALLNVRAALAARRLGVVVERLPDPQDPDLLAVVRPRASAADPYLPRLDRAAHRRHTNRRSFGPARLPDDVLAVLADAAAAEDTLLVPVTSEDQRHLVGELTLEADRLQNADPAYRAELQRWTTRQPAQGDGVAAHAVPHLRATPPDAVPVRDFDPPSAGRLPSRAGPATGETLLLLATARDDVLAWLRSGEALERLLLELTWRDWVAGPVTQALEVPSARARLQDLTGAAHPQMLLRIGQAAATEPAARRPRRGVVRGSTRPDPPQPAAQVPPLRPDEPVHRAVPDGRGGTTWT
jgi:nitroreductase